MDKGRWGASLSSPPSPHPPPNSPGLPEQARGEKRLSHTQTRGASQWFLRVLFALSRLLQTATLLISFHPCANSIGGESGAVNSPRGAVEATQTRHVTARRPQRAPPSDKKKGEAEHGEANSELAASLVLSGAPPDPQLPVSAPQSSGNVGGM